MSGSSGPIVGSLLPCVPFARTIEAAKKYVVSSTLDRVDWNAELVHDDWPRPFRLKQQPCEGLFVGGVTLAPALAELELIDEYEFVVHPRLAGHGPTLFAGLSGRIDLKLVGRLELDSGAMTLRYEPSSARSRFVVARQHANPRRSVIGAEQTDLAR